MDALPEFSLLRPRTLDELMRARAENSASSLLGGGTPLIAHTRPRISAQRTRLIVNILRVIVAPPGLIYVSDVSELRGIKADADALEIGAAATLSDLAAPAGVTRHYPGGAQAARDSRRHSA